MAELVMRSVLALPSLDAAQVAIVDQPRLALQGSTTRGRQVRPRTRGATRGHVSRSLRWEKSISRTSTRTSLSIHVALYPVAHITESMRHAAYSLDVGGTEAGFVGGEHCRNRMATGWAGCGWVHAARNCHWGHEGRSVHGCGDDGVCAPGTKSVARTAGLAFELGRRAKMPDQIRASRIERTGLERGAWRSRSWSLHTQSTP